MKTIKLLLSLSLALALLLNHAQGMNPSSNLSRVESSEDDQNDNNKRNVNIDENEQQKKQKRIKQETINKLLLQECNTANQKTEKIKSLIENKGEVNYRDYAGNTPLHLACYKNASLEIVKYLIENKTDVNNKNDNNWTYLHLACNEKASLETIQYLINNKAHVTCEDEFCNTALHKICNNKNASCEIIKYLINNKADVTSKNHNEWTSLHNACSYNTPLPVIKALLASFIDTQVIVTYLCYIKRVAQQIKQIIPKPIILIILKNTFKSTINDIKNYINMTNKFGKTARTIAQQKGHTDIVNFLNQILELLEDGSIQHIIVFLNS